MGNSSKFFDKNKIEKFGGFILCGVGLKILVENF
jgi:putative Mn2+ efflux pump MntP